MQALTQDRGRKWRKAGFAALLGGLAGFAGAFAVLRMEDAGMLGSLSGSQMIALLVALMYLVMGLAVGFGAMSPNLGARFLNVEDADELREERATLAPSAIGLILLALALAALTLAGSGGILSPAAAIAVIGIALVASVWLSLRSLRRADELMRQVMNEGAAASFYFAFTVLGGWAAFAHLDLVAAPVMLDIVTLFYVLTLVGCFWVCGRRGMLTPR